MKYDNVESEKIKKIADVKRKKLTELLNKPLFPKGFSGKYPLQVELNTLAIKTDVKTIQEERAIDVLKTALQKNAKTKQNPIFKKRHTFQKQAEKSVVKTIQKTNKNRKSNRN